MKNKKNLKNKWIKEAYKFRFKKIKLRKCLFFLTKSIKFSILEIALSGFFLGIQLIAMYLFKLTLLRFIPFNVQIEMFFYIMYGLVFGGIKGSILSVIADLLGLLISGTIGEFYWGYALVNIAIPIIASLYFNLFRKNAKIGQIMAFVIILLGIIVTITTLFYFSNGGKISLKPSRNPKKNKLLLSTQIMFWILMFYTFLAIVVLTSFVIAYHLKKNNKWLNYIIVFSLIVFIYMLFRWALGSILYIDYFNTFRASKSKLGRMNLKDHYLLWMYPHVLKSIFIIPINTIIFVPTFGAINYIKNKLVNKIYQISY